MNRHITVTMPKTQKLNSQNLYSVICDMWVWNSAAEDMELISPVVEWLAVLSREFRTLQPALWTVTRRQAPPTGQRLRRPTGVRPAPAIT